MIASLAFETPAANLPAVAEPPINTLAIAEFGRALEVASTLEEIKGIEARLDAIEHYARSAGLYPTEKIRPINELRMRARWRLGQELQKLERGTGPGRGRKKVLSETTSFVAVLNKLRIERRVALEAQRIGTMPESELVKAFDAARAEARLCHLSELIVRARPYWYSASRSAKHRKIAAEAITANPLVGQFPLIYADPPWRFEVYNTATENRLPDDHYPTLTDDEIIHFRIDGRPIAEIAHEDAALFLWCTSSNQHRALDVMESWGFKFRTSAVWVKDRYGTGLVFRNRHELLLYGIRGDMPGPQWQPESVFEFPREEHSAKPPEIRAAIERMYPDFDARGRLELFARGSIPGWTSRGFEARPEAGR